MGDTGAPTELVQRLHKLRVGRGLTIQQMAEACDLPKSSLESYMRLDGARRPGVDALVAIADGMQVSIDWLVGRAADSFSPKLTEKDYAMACFSVVLGLINWLREKQAASEPTVIGKETIAGVPDSEVAAKSMLVFVENMALFRATSGQSGMQRGELYDALSGLLMKEQDPAAE